MSERHPMFATVIADPAQPGDLFPRLSQGSLRSVHFIGPDGDLAGQVSRGPDGRAAPMLEFKVGNNGVVVPASCALLWDLARFIEAAYPLVRSAERPSDEMEERPDERRE